MLDAFFKYYTAESLKLTLGKTTRKWSSPSEFNDPFDNRLDIHWAGSPIEFENAITERVVRLVEEEEIDLKSLFPEMRYLVSSLRDLPLAKRSEALRELKEPEGVYTQEMLDAMHVKLNGAITTLLFDTSIFCLTEDHDNLLMWAHYTDNHRGGVVKFLPIKEVDSPLLVAKKVNYSKSVPSISYVNILDNTQEFRRAVIDEMTLTKSIDWQYEKEWRIVTSLRNPTNKYEILPFAEEEVGGLYLGCRISEADKSQLIELMVQKYPWAPIYQATPKRNEFSLTFDRVE